MSERRRIVFEGVEAVGIGSIEEQVKKELGIDISKSNQYEIEYYGFSDNEGISETGYTEFKVVRVIPSMDIEWQPIEEIPETKEKTVDEAKKQDMLDKYYGNKKKEREYQKRIKRFKSHIVDKEFEYEGANGEILTGICKTIEDYPEKAKDSEFLQLQDYAYKLERLSRAEAGDTSMYEVPAKKFEKIKKGRLRDRIESSKDDTDVFKKKKLEQQEKNMSKSEEESIKESIAILQQADSDYLATNNFAYNQHQTTQGNLPTLGKYGEKVPFLKMSQGKDVKTVAKNIGKSAANVWLAGRNYIAAPIDRAIGTYVVAPVHRILYNSEKNSKGVYKGIPSHRYTARKDYFTHEYMKELDRENKEREANGKPPKKPSMLKLAFGVRFQAMVNYKQGNIAVLSAGAHDIEQDTLRKEHEEWLKEARRRSYDKTEAKMYSKIDICKEKIKSAQTEEERLDWEAALQEATANLLEIQKRIKENEQCHIDSVIQTDAVSMAQHDKANKANITRVVSGVKSVARISAMSYLGKNLSKYVAEKTTEQKWVPEQIVEKEQFVPGEINQEGLTNIKVSDLVEATKNGEVSYSSTGGNIVEKPDDAFLRGIAINNINGKTISGSDGNGFSILGRTDVQMDTMTNDTTIFEAISETMTKAGQPVTSQELIDQIMSSPNPQEALETMLKGTRIWVSTRETGIPTGWLDVSDGVKQISQAMTEGHMETITTTIPGYMTTVVSESMKKVIDGRVAAMEALLAAGSARDLYELARRTKSKEEMQKEGTYKKQVTAHQKDNKPEKRNYYDNKYGFVGTKKGDYASDYDENAMGLNGKNESQKEEDSER